MIRFCVNSLPLFISPMSNVLISYSEFEGSLNVRIFLPFCFFLSNCPSSFLIRSRYFYTLIVLARLSLVFPFILPICIFVRGPLTNISVAPMASIGKIVNGWGMECLECLFIPIHTYPYLWMRYGVPIQNMLWIICDLWWCDGWLCVSKNWNKFKCVLTFCILETDCD